MSDQFIFDVFLSHSSRDKAVVRDVAERLRKDGLRVWFDEWVLRPGDSIPAKIEEGLEGSRVLVLCMSAQAFGSDWARLESYTFRFRDPLNKERAFVLLRLDKSPIKGSLALFLYINWLAEEREQEYAKLLEACRPPAKPKAEVEAARDQAAERAIQLDYKAGILAYAFSPDGKRALSGGYDHTVRLWDIESGHCLRVLEGHTDDVCSVALSADQRRALSGSSDRTVGLWDVETGRRLLTFGGHTDRVLSVAWSADQRRSLSGSWDKTVRIWDVETGRCLRVLEGHIGEVFSVVWSADQRRVLSGSKDNTLRLWDVETGRCLRVFEGHTDYVWIAISSADEGRAISGSGDNTLRLWDMGTGRCLRVLEGHTLYIGSVAWNADQRRALSGSWDKTLRLWDLETGRCLSVLEAHTDSVISVAWSADSRRAFSGDVSGGIHVWDLSAFATTEDRSLEQIQYTNAKVVVVGETGAGKTGLTERLALDTFTPSYSTSGAWSTQWPMQNLAPQPGWERQVWLWDFGGQADQRLIHQLYLDKAALILMIFPLSSRKGAMRIRNQR
jgi:WD40 repeat protein